MACSWLDYFIFLSLIFVCQVPICYVAFVINSLLLLFFLMPRNNLEPSSYLICIEVKIGFLPASVGVVEI